MESYISTNGKPSGVVAYEIRPNAILIQFRDGGKFLYTYQSAGKAKVEKMKELALASHGLNTYISQEKPHFASNY